MQRSYRQELEKALGRKLLSSEIVHHIDGDKYNNSLDNLKIVTKKQHKKIHNSATFYNNNIKALLDRSDSLRLENFQSSLKEFFTPYQISLIIRKINNLPLSKTDGEVYSRTVKKKLIALSNDNLFSMANKVILQG